MQEYEDEIEVLENALSNLESAISDIQDSPYHSYLANSWKMDLEEIQARLDELYELQDRYWANEMKAQNIAFEEARI